MSDTRALRTERQAQEKTALDPSYIESGPPSSRDDSYCSFCRSEDKQSLHRIVWSRNGFQEHVFVICRPCRDLLRQHLEDEPDSEEAESVA